MTDEWSLHFHRTIKMVGGTRELNVYTLRHDGNTVVTMFMPMEEGYLANVIIQALKQSFETPKPTQELQKFAEIFHGPWTHHEDGTMHLSLSHADAHKIKKIVFHFATEKSSIEASYENLRKDFARVVKRNEILEQEVLRLRQRGMLDPQAETLADLLRAPERKTDELPFTHQSQVLCVTGGCGEV